MCVHFFLQGLVIGFSIAAPVGPIGVLCLRRSLTQGRRIGFISGLGAATADAVYGAIAGFGLTALSSFLTGHTFGLRLVGGLFLLWLGVKTALARPAEDSAAMARLNQWQAYTSTLFLTLTNPTTILSFVAIFAGLGLAAERNDYPSATLLVLGVFLGSALWWLLLSQLAGLLRTRLTPPWLQRVNWLSGFILITFGIIALFSLRGGI